MLKRGALIAIYIDGKFRVGKNACKIKKVYVVS
jgi:hypothetical protein